MDPDALLGSAVWIACTVGFLFASFGLVQALDEGTVALPDAASRLALEHDGAHGEQSRSDHARR